MGLELFVPPVHIFLDEVGITSVRKYRFRWTRVDVDVGNGGESPNMLDNFAKAFGLNMF